MRMNKCFFNPFALVVNLKWFSLCLESDIKILPLCYKHVIAMSSRKIRGKSQLSGVGVDLV